MTPKMADELTAQEVRALRVPVSPALENIRVVLHETKDARNIGSTARAMKGMGLTRLWLANPLCDWRNSAEAKRLATNSEEVLENAVETTTLAEAIADAHFLVGTTHRRRERRMGDPVPIREAAQEIVAQAQTHQVALVFGREDFGISNEDLSQMNLTTSVPMATKNPSLNLSQAAQIVAYEIFMASLSEPPAVPYRLASHSDMEALYFRIQEMLRWIEFEPRNDDWMTIRVPVERVLGRTRLEKRDIGVIMEICHDVEEFIKRKFRRDGVDGWRSRGVEE